MQKQIENIAKLLVILGEDIASQIIPKLEKKEQMAILQFMNKSLQVNQTEAAVLIENFLKFIGEQKFAINSDYDGYIKKLIKNTKNDIDAHRLILDYENETARLSSLDHQSIEIIHSLLEQEALAVQAITLSLLDSVRAGSILKKFSPGETTTIIQKIATLSQVEPQYIQLLNDVFSKKLKNKEQGGPIQLKGKEKILAMLQKLDQASRNQFLAQLREKDPIFTDKVEEELFTFRDLCALDVKVLQTILAKLQNEKLALALRSISPDLQNTLLNAVSERRKDQILEEMKYSEKRKMSEVEEAQIAILELARDLEAQGVISLSDEPYV